MRFISFFVHSIAIFSVVFLSCFANAEISKKLVTIHLQPDVTISKRFVSIADLAEVTIEDAEIKRLVQEIKVATAPPIGYVEKITKQELEAIIKSRISVGLIQIHWQGADSTTLRSAGQLISTDLLTNTAKKFVTRELGSYFKDIDIQLASNLADVEVPIGDVEFRGRKIDVSHISTRYPVWIDIYVNGRLGRSVIVPLKLRPRKEVLISKRDLNEGAIVEINDFQVKTEDIADLTDLPIDAAEIEEGVRLKRKISVGQILTKHSLHQRGVVLRGDIVRLSLTERNVTIEVSALAQEDGRIGEIVKVKPETSKEAISGRVIAPGVVKVD